MKTLVIFAFAILLPALAYHPHRARVQQASSDDEMYEVYSVAIQDLFLIGRDERKSDNDLRAIVVISDHTMPYSWEKWNDPTQTTHKWAKNGLAIDSRIVEDFKRKCKYSVSLEMRFAFPAKQVLISDKELDNFFRIFAHDSWERFYKRYPDSIGWVSVSRVGFNLNHDQAFLYVALGCGDLCGSGYYAFVAKTGGAWSVKHTYPLWVS